MNKIIFLFSVFFFFSCAQNQTKMTFDLKEYIYIPVKIKGKEYKFIFDTGTTYTVLSHDLVEELGNSCQLKDSVKINSYEARGIKISNMYDDLLFNIGGLTVKGAFTSNRNDTSNILGMNLISQLHWLLNFQDSTVSISRDSISVDSNGLIPWKLTYMSDENCIIPVHLNDSVVKNFIFDTGYARTTDPAACCKPDMVFHEGTDSLIRQWVTKEKGNLYSELSNGQKIFICPTFKINDLTWDYVLAILELRPYHDHLVKNLNLHGFFTLSFVSERCSMMRINPETKTITLYTLGEEGTWREEKIKRVHEVLVEQYYRNQEQAQ